MINTINGRQIQRGYSKIFDEVMRTKEPVIITSKNKPMVAIISLDDLDELRQARYRTSAQRLLNLAEGAKEFKSEAPTDLAKNHDKYTWDK
jgi:prevent-host-death family protein